MTGPRWTSTSDPYITQHQGDAWATEAAARGHIGSQQLLAVDTIPAEPHIRHALNLTDGEQVVVRRRLILEDNQPVELADSYYPHHIAGDTPLAEHRKVKGGALRVLADLGRTPTHVVEHVTARRPDSHEQATLHVGEHEPLLVLTRLSRDADGHPVEYAVMRAVASRTTGHTYQMQVTA